MIASIQNVAEMHSLVLHITGVGRKNLCMGATIPFVSDLRRKKWCQTVLSLAHEGKLQAHVSAGGNYHQANRTGFRFTAAEDLTYNVQFSV